MTSIKWYKASSQQRITLGGLKIGVATQAESRTANEHTRLKLKENGRAS